MATTEGSFRTGWLVLFTLEETEDIADSAAAVGIVAGLLAEPAVSKAVAAAAGAVSLAARRARRKGFALGLRLKLHGMPNDWDRLNTLEVLDLFGHTRLFPIFYSPTDQATVERWRNRFRL